MDDTRALSAEGVAILEALIEGAGSPLLSDSVLSALENTGLITRTEGGWILSDLGRRSLEIARTRLHDESQSVHRNG